MDPLDAVVALRSKRINNLPEWVQVTIRKSTDPIADAEAAQVAHRIVTRYGGPARLARLVEMFECSESVVLVAREFAVTKQRASQWRRALGFVEEKFVARNVIKQALRRGAHYDPP
jgi:hypothetical protein